MDYGDGYHWSNVLKNCGKYGAGTRANRKKDLEVLALRNTSTTTPDTVARSVGRAGIVGGKT